MVLHNPTKQLKCRKARKEVDKLELLRLLIQNFTHFRLILSLLLENLTYTDHDLAVPLLGIYQEEMKNILPHKLRISCSKLANLASIPRLLTNSKIIEWAIGKQHVTLPYSKILFINKQQQTIDICNNIDEFIKHCAE